MIPDILVTRDARHRDGVPRDLHHAQGAIAVWFAPAILHTDPAVSTVLLHATGASHSWTIGLNREGRVNVVLPGESEAVVLPGAPVRLLTWSIIRVRVEGRSLIIQTDGDERVFMLPEADEWRVLIGSRPTDDPGPADSFVGVLADSDPADAAAPALNPAEAWRIEDAAYANDRDRPRWHFLPPSGWMNEPHGILHHRGRHHLFYQRNERGPFWGDITWGHAVSDNLVDWDDLGSALIPAELPVAPDGVWSGSSAVDSDGVPLLFFTAGDNTDAPNQRTALARAMNPEDPDLLHWVAEAAPITRIDAAREAIASEGSAVLPEEFRDPYVWTEGGRWFQIVGGGIEDEGGTAFVFEAAHPAGPWAYRGPLLVGDTQKYPATGVMWELPSLVPLRDGGKERHALLVTPWWPVPTEHSLNHQWYWLGDWDPERAVFVPDEEAPRDLDLGGYLTGATPSRHPDGRVIIWSITQDLRGPEAHRDAIWAGHAGVPVELVIVGDRLVPQPIREIEALRGEPRHVTVGADETIAVDVGPRWDAVLRNRVGSSGSITVALRASSDDEAAAVKIQITRVHEKLARVDVTGPPRRGPRSVDIPLRLSEEMHLRILADHSAVELFIGGVAMLTTRAWSEAAGERTRITTHGDAEMTSATIYPMRAAQMGSRRKTHLEETV